MWRVHTGSGDDRWSGTGHELSSGPPLRVSNAPPQPRIFTPGNSLPYPGIGANAAVFSWIEGILFRPYPTVTHQEQLVAIGSTSRGEAGATPLSWPDFQDLQRSCTLCETVFVSKITGTTLRIGDRAFVLLIACANVGNLLLVRSFARRHEMSVRLALVAARARLWKQLLTEGLVLSSFGAMGGLLVAYSCRHLLVLLFPTRAGVQMHLPGELDWRVLALSAGVSPLTAVLWGVVPAMQTGKIDLASSMNMASAGVVGGRGRTWARSGLVSVQVSLSFILLVATSLLMQSLLKIRTASPGFTTRGVQETAIDLVSAGYNPARAQTFQDALLERVRALPGVESAAFAKMTPLSYISSASAPIVVDGYAPPPEESPTVEYNEVGPDYFVTMGIPLVAGREFTRADDERAAQVAVVNKTMAQRYWNGRNPLGERLQFKSRWVRIVGVVKDSKYSSVREEPTPFFFVPLWQDSFSASALKSAAM